MSTTVNNPEPSPQALDEFENCRLRIKGFVSAKLLWDRYLSPGDRKRFDDDLEDAYKRLGTAGIWARLRGVTIQRAVLDVAKKLQTLTDENYEWLLRESGEILDPEEAKEQAIIAGHLVVVEPQREVHWKGARIEVDWHRNEAQWVFLDELCRHAKAGRPVDRFSFGERAHQDVVTKRKSRLLSIRGFPIDLGVLIEPVDPRTQQLRLPPEQIRIFERDGVDSLREWTP